MTSHAIPIPTQARGDVGLGLVQAPGDGPGPARSHPAAVP